MASVPFTLRLDPSLKAGLEDAAQSTDRTPSYLAAKAIEAFLNARAQKQAAIEAALGEAAQGKWISQDKMDAWVMSWGKPSELSPPDPDIDLGS